MKRRAFTKLTGLSAVAISTTGFVKFNGTTYTGDCETTTDILGPFYRPNSPVRNNLVVEGLPGDLVELSGVVRHKDCTTPYKKAKVELWHCSAEEVYDNDSQDYLYRGTTYCDENGRYSFKTQMPVPYDVGDGTIRPAHFHLMVTAPGYQSLVTQIYFTGDPYLEKDVSSSSPQAINRILDVGREDGKLKVAFNCNMNEQLLASHKAIKQITGKYRNEASGKIKELFEKDGQLWMKNEVFGVRFDYVGENTFRYPGMQAGMYRELIFEFTENNVSLQFRALEEDGIKKDLSFKKEG